MNDVLTVIAVLGGVFCAFFLVAYAALDCWTAYQDCIEDEKRECARRNLEHVINRYAPAHSQSVRRFTRQGRW